MNPAPNMGDSIGVPGEVCNDGPIPTTVTDCTKRDFTPIVSPHGHGCRCSISSTTNECAAGNYCWGDNTCNANPVSCPSGYVLGSTGYRASWPTGWQGGNSVEQNKTISYCAERCNNESTCVEFHVFSPTGSKLCRIFDAAGTLEGFTNTGSTLTCIKAGAPTCWVKEAGRRCIVGAYDIKYLPAPNQGVPCETSWSTDATCGTIIYTDNDSQCACLKPDKACVGGTTEDGYNVYECAK